MISTAAKAHFEHRLARIVPALSALRPSAGVEAMIEFYQDIRADDCDLERDGDMLLFQWGTYNWGRGDRFEFGIVRQFIGASGEDEDIWQLSLTFRFPPEQPLRDLSRGERWCHSLEELPAFQTFVLSSPAYAAVASRNDVVPELDYQCAG